MSPLSQDYSNHPESSSPFDQSAFVTQSRVEMVSWTVKAFSQANESLVLSQLGLRPLNSEMMAADASSYHRLTMLLQSVGTACLP